MTRTSAQEFLGALKRLAAIHLHNDVKRIFVDGDDVCVIYDFVTDTPASICPRSSPADRAILVTRGGNRCS